jgi:integrase
MLLSTVNEKLALMLEQGVDIGVIAAISLMYQTGCRISSILQIKPSSISANGRIILHQGKGSEPMVVVPADYREWWINYRNGNMKYYELQNYIYYYRLFKRYKLVAPSNFGTKDAVTATARKMVAMDTFSVNEDLNDAKIALGHKSINSTGYYVTDKQAKGGGVALDKNGRASGTYFDTVTCCKNGVIKLKKQQHNAPLQKKIE